MKPIHTYLHLCKDGLLLSCPTGDGLTGVDIIVGSPSVVMDAAAGDPPTLVTPQACYGAGVVQVWRSGVPTPEVITFVYGGPCDVDLDGDPGTSKDVKCFVEAVDTGSCPLADWDNNNTAGDRDDLLAFLRSLSV